jgi:uncharacterized protein YpiB (UPF0302 family)
MEFKEDEYIILERMSEIEDIEDFDFIPNKPYKIYDIDCDGDIEIYDEDDESFYISNYDFQYIRHATKDEVDNYAAKKAKQELEEMQRTDLRQEDIYSLIDIALDSKDKDWFEELMKRKTQYLLNN